MLKTLSLSIIGLSILFSCKKSEENASDHGHPELHELIDVMQGSYNSAKQEAQDSSYFNISLHMVPIWEGQGHYLYVEQAMFAAQDRPYRQRVYKVEENDDKTFSSIVYELPDAKQVVGWWKTPEKFQEISPEDLILREGCAVVLERIGENHFKGKTGATSCKSTLRGASYATSAVEIFADKIISWDQGFDSEGNQVWGAEKGGYVFDKLN